MSDYLWDKRGRPAAEVERLELLLGTLRHEPRPLELPADAAPPETRPRGPLFAGRRLRATRPFAPASFAIAAGLLLAFLLGAAVFLRPPTRDGRGPSASRGAGQSERPRAAAVAGAASASGVTERRASESVVRAGQSRPETAAVRNITPTPRRTQNVSTAPAQKRRQRLVPPARGGERAGGLAFEAMRAGGAPSLIENTRLLAKEQLVYALRLTGAQLRDVRLRAQGLDEESSPKKRERKR